MSKVHYEMVSKIGKIYLSASEKGLCAADFRKPAGSFLKSLKADTPQEKILRQAENQLEEYLDGGRKIFDIPLDIDGTPFQKKVWKELTRIPYGRAVSYSHIATKIKNPKAVRAVGGANGKNPVCIIIPCHRVISSDGSIGGYSGGLANKRRLLELEGHEI